MSKKRTAGALEALAVVRRVAQEWADGVAANVEAMGHWDKSTEAKDQEFYLADIMRMIDDAAREVGAEGGHQVAVPPGLLDDIPEIKVSRGGIKYEPGPQAVTVKLDSPSATTRSFLILPGDTLRISLDGFVESIDGKLLNRITVPVTIRATIA